MLAEKLNMDEQQAERWIVNLIRNAQLDAKIDTAKGAIVLLMLFMQVLFLLRPCDHGRAHELVA